MSNPNPNQWNQQWGQPQSQPQAPAGQQPPQGTMYDPAQYPQQYPQASYGQPPQASYGQYPHGYGQPQGTMYNPQAPAQGTMYNPQATQDTMYNPQPPAQSTMYNPPAYAVPPQQMSGYGYAQPVATEDEPNLLKGIAAGTVAAIIGSVIWIVISGVTHYQIGWMAVGVGFLVGISIQKFGKGSDPVFGFAGAGLSLAACVAGNMILGLSFSPMDILFYGLAIYEGYRFSIKQ